jgi:hypothetical protein
LTNGELPFQEVADVSSLFEWKKAGKCLSPGRPSKYVVGVSEYRSQCFNKLWYGLEACWEVERWQRPGFFSISTLLKELKSTVTQEG